MRQRKEILSIAMFGQRGADDPSGGGVEVVVAELATRMAAMGHTVTCYNRSTAQHVNRRKRATEYNGVREKYVPTVNRKGLAAVSSSFCAAIACSFGKYDVVHIHAEGPAAMCWLLKLFGKRVVVTVHGLDWQREKWRRGFGVKYIRIGERCAVKYADEIIVLSEGVKKYFNNTYGRKTIFIPNGVNRPELRNVNLIRERCGLEKDSYILFLGRLVPEKGIKYLIDAFKDVQTDKKLVIAGGNSDTEAFMRELKALAGEDRRIIFTGFVQGQFLEELYSNAYVYCLPSDLEGMPLSLLEAMSYGNCCVVSDIPECADVVEDKAVVFPKGNISKLTETLQKLCDSPKLTEEYKQNAANFACGKYDWEKVVDSTLALYQRSSDYADPVYQ